MRDPAHILALREPPPAAFARPLADGHVVRAAGDVVVTLGSPLADDISDAWRALSLRASPNVFMCPAVLRAAHETGFAQVHVLQAWLRDARPRRLLGLWALQDSRLTRMGPAMLAAPPYRDAFVSNPVVDADCMDIVMPAMLDAIAQDDSLPKVLRMRLLDADSASYPALLRALAARGARAVKVSEHTRPFATRELGAKPSGATRKKLRQKWKRLAASGSAEVRNDRSPAAVRQALETFLAMEAASWKGERGTALLSDAGDAHFMRRMIAALAAEGSASVALLLLDGQPIATQVLFYSGSMAYTWKTAFDARFAAFSPGALLLDRITDQLLDAERFEGIESCSTEDSFMNQLWRGRRTTVHLLADLGVRKSVPFAAIAMGARTFVQLRDTWRTNGQ